LQGVLNNLADGRLPQVASAVSLVQPVLEALGKAAVELPHGVVVARLRMGGNHCFLLCEPLLQPLLRERICCAEGDEVGHAFLPPVREVGGGLLDGVVLAVEAHRHEAR
jgi:hypothetical protein